jgi:hypothetical protein
MADYAPSLRQRTEVKEQEEDRSEAEDERYYFFHTNTQ